MVLVANGDLWEVGGARDTQVLLLASVAGTKAWKSWDTQDGEGEESL